MTSLRQIVMLSPRLPPDVFGGAENQCLRLSKALESLGCEVVVLTTTCSSQLDRRAMVAGVSVVRFRTKYPPDHGGRHFTSTLKWTAEVLMWLFRNRRSVRLIHVHQGKLHLLPCLFAKSLFGIPYLVKVGNAEEKFDLTQLAAKRGRYGQWVFGALLRTCSAHVAISSRIAGQMEAVGVPLKRIHQIPNGVDTDEFPASAFDPQNGARQFFFSGRLEPEKQPLMMVQCFHAMLEAMGRSAAGHRLFVAGDGSCYEQLEEYCTTHDLADHIKLLGRVDDVRPALAQSQFIVLPSSNEGMSNALLEAMSSGLVPIASAVSGSTDVIRHGRTGFLFDRDDPTEFIGCLKTAAAMSLSEWRVMSQAARRTIECHYSIDKVAQSYSNLYNSIGCQP